MNGETRFFKYLSFKIAPKIGLTDRAIHVVIFPINMKVKKLVQTAKMCKFLPLKFIFIMSFYAFSF